MIRHLRLRAFVPFFFLATSAAAEEAIIMKTGLINLSHDRQHLEGVERKIEESGDNVYSLAWEHRNFEGAALGLEYIRFDNEWTTPGSARQGDMVSRVLLVSAKRYVQTATSVFPHLGMGIGVVNANAHGASFDPALGLALQLTAGVEFRWQMAGIYTEIKGLYADTGTGFGDDFNNSGVGAFVGLSLLF